MVTLGQPDGVVMATRRTQIALFSDGGPFGKLVLQELHRLGVAPSLVVRETRRKSIVKRLRYRRRKYGFGPTLLWFIESAVSHVRNMGNDAPVPPIAETLEADSVNSEESVRLLSQMSHCLIVNTVSSIISSRILSIPEGGVFGVHPGLLPKYVGLSSIHWQVYDGVIPGITVFRLTERIDDGPSYVQETVPPLADETFGHYQERFTAHCASALARFTASMCDGVKPTPLTLPAEQALNRGLMPWSARFRLSRNWRRMTRPPPGGAGESDLGTTIPTLLSGEIFASHEGNCGTGVSPVGTRARRPCHSLVAAEGSAVRRPESPSPTQAFQDWAMESFRTFVGISSRDAERLIDWGENTGRSIIIPRLSADLFQAPQFGFAEGLPWLTLSDAEKPLVQKADGQLVFGFDAITATGWLLGGYEEYSSFDRDSFGRWEETNSVVSLNGFTELPAINVWVNHVRDFLIEIGEKPLPPWPEGKTIAVALTHDVDNPRYSLAAHSKNFIKAACARDAFGARHALMKLLGSLVIMGRDGFSSSKGFTALLDAESKLGLRSTVMLSGLRRGSGYARPHDPTYDVSDCFLQASLEKARHLGFPVGLHASMATASATERYREQKEHLENAFGQPIRSLRHHYWNISNEDTADALEAMRAAGVEYDTSISFYRRANFRRSIAWPYAPFHPRLDRPITITELPSSFMDNWLGTTEPAPTLRRHLRLVEEHNGLAVLDWHANRFNNQRYLAQGQVYLDVLRELSGRSDVWLAPIEEIGRWWRDRARQLSFDSGKTAIRKRRS